MNYTQDQMDLITDFLENCDGFFYNKGTGQVFRIRELKCIGDDGTTNTVNYKGRSLQATHLMFFLATGQWPAKGMYVDHKDGNPENNCWDNLRIATPKQNSQNRQSPGRWYNEHLPRGVYFNKGRYQVSVDSISFGSYATLEEATEVVSRERKRLQGEFAFEGRQT